MQIVKHNCKLDVEYCANIFASHSRHAIKSVQSYASLDTHAHNKRGANEKRGEKRAWKKMMLK